jgi:hypothetical protein
MTHRIDQIARILATPMPRRRAFGLLAGAVLGSFFVPRALAACHFLGCSCSGGGSCNPPLVCKPCAAGGSACTYPQDNCCSAGSTGNGKGFLPCPAPCCGTTCCGVNQCCTSSKSCASSNNANGNPCNPTG